MDGKMQRRAQPVRKTTPMESRNRPRLTRIREPETSRPRDDECVVAERPRHVVRVDLRDRVAVIAR